MKKTQLMRDLDEARNQRDLLGKDLDRTRWALHETEKANERLEHELTVARATIELIVLGGSVNKTKPTISKENPYDR